MYYKSSGSLHCLFHLFFVDVVADAASAVLLRLINYTKRKGVKVTYFTCDKSNGRPIELFKYTRRAIKCKYEYNSSYVISKNYKIFF